MFGSELKCLMQCESTPCAISAAAVSHYFTLSYIPHPWTIYEGVQQLPPAGRLVARGDQLSIDRYWSVRSRVNHQRAQSEACDELRGLITDAVRLRMVSDVPLGAFLSGGLDSSIVVAEMARASSEPIKTFYIDFDQPGYSEREFARAVATHYGTEHHEMLIRPSAAEILDDLVDYFDEPFGDASAIPTYYVSKMTREHVTVALAGDGGDESFGGYMRYHRILARRELPGPLRSAIGAAGRVAYRVLPSRAPGRRYARSLGLDGWRFYAGIGSELETREMLSPDFLKSVPPGAAFDIARPYLECGDPDDALSPYSTLDLCRYLPDDILVKVDRMSMANSLEVRAPFLDYRIVELACTFPSEWKVRQDTTKVILKEMFTGELPSGVMQQRKRGFSPPLKHWLRNELRSQLEEALHDKDIEALGVFRMGKVRAIADEHLSGTRDRTGKLWCFLFFTRWWHRFHRRAQASRLHAAAGVS